MLVINKDIILWENLSKTEQTYWTKEYLRSQAVKDAIPGIAPTRNMPWDKNYV